MKSTTAKSRIIALDVGELKTGIAITNIDHTIIKPLATIKLKKFNGKKLFDQIKMLLSEYWEEIATIVIGIPYNLDQKTLNFSYKYVSQMLRIFRAWTNWDVIEQSETYSTKWSEEKMMMMKYSKKQIKNKADSLAAAKILYDFLINQDLHPLIVLFN